MDVLNADEFRALVNAKGSASQKASLGTANTDWQREIYRNAYTTDNNVSISGAAGVLPYRISTGYLYQKGLLKRNDLKRYTGVLTLNPVLLDGSLRVTLNLKGSWIDNNFSDQGAIGAAVQYDPTQPVTSDDPCYAKFGGYYQFLDPSGNGNLNPVALLSQNPTVPKTLSSILGRRYLLVTKQWFRTRYSLTRRVVILALRFRSMRALASRRRSQWATSTRFIKAKAL